MAHNIRQRLIVLLWLLISPGCLAQSNDSISYEEVRAIVDAAAGGEPTTLLIDVRSRGELQSLGKIPGAENVPLQEIRRAFDADVTSEAEFANKYGFVRPTRNTTPFILYCRSGRRARIAQGILMELGYIDNPIRVYDGSFNEWQAKKGPIEKVQKWSILTFKPPRYYIDS